MKPFTIAVGLIATIWAGTTSLAWRIQGLIVLWSWE